MDNPAKTRVVSPESPIPQTLQHFRLEGLLGEGGMGLVYRAFDTRLQRPVAVKLLATELTSDPQRKQRLLQEARAAARISHPAIAQIFFADEDAGVTFIVMELVEGKTVQELVQSGQLDLLGTMDIGIQVAEGLAQAHKCGIVHRDIKPANVMLTPDGRAKILDFGIAKRVDQDLLKGPAETERLSTSSSVQTLPGVILGTPAYMSPEQVRGLPVDQRADIFSLGVLLFEMATGSSPFVRANPMDALHAVAYEEAPPLITLRPGVPDGLQRVVSRCLQKDAAGRYPEAHALAADLRKLRRDTEASLVQPSSWRQRMAEAWENLRQLPPSRYGWYVAGMAGLGMALYLVLAEVNLGVLFLAALMVVFLYRHVRNRPYRVQELFVRRVSKIPEVRLIVFQDRQITVVVDRPVAQLYGRINDRLRACNRKLYAGQPLTVAILHDLPSDEVRRLQGGPGVHFVRAENAKQGGTSN